MKTAEEIFKSKIGEFKSDYPVIYNSDGLKKFVLEAMEQYRNEGLREELIKFLKEYHTSMFVVDLQNSTIDFDEMIDEYLKQKP
jgi:hypothetical protein